MSLFFVEFLNGFNLQPRPSESLGFPAKDMDVDKAKSESHGVFLVMGPADSNQVNKYEACPVERRQRLTCAWEQLCQPFMFVLLLPSV